MQNLLSKPIMELMLVITVLCFTLFLLQSPCVSLDIQVHPSLQKANEVQLSVSTLPRKLRFTTDQVTVKGHADHQETVSDKKQKEVAPGKQYKKEEKVMHGSKGTWQEWVEGTDTSQYFTMDYSHVKRRRPIHNKSLPVGP